MSDCPLAGPHGPTGLVSLWGREYSSGSAHIGVELAKSAEGGDRARYDTAMNQLNLLSAVDKNDGACTALAVNERDQKLIPGLPSLKLVMTIRSDSAHLDSIDVENATWRK